MNNSTISKIILVSAALFVSAVTVLAMVNKPEVARDVLMNHSATNVSKSRGTDFDF